MHACLHARMHARHCVNARPVVSVKDGPSTFAAVICVAFTEIGATARRDAVDIAVLRERARMGRM